MAWRKRLEPGRPVPCEERTGPWRHGAAVGLWVSSECVGGHFVDRSGRGRRLSVLEDEQDLRRERIETFARLLVGAYGFEGYEAERERELIVRALEENRDPVDYVGLRQRAKRHLQSSEIRQILTEAGLPDHELQAVLLESVKQTSRTMRDRPASAGGHQSL